MAETDAPQTRVATFVERWKADRHPRFLGSWEDPVWEVLGIQNVSNRNRVRLHFAEEGRPTARGSARERSEGGWPEPDAGVGESQGKVAPEPFEPPFGDFARAVCCAFAHSKQARPGSASPFFELILALRLLHAALPRGARSPENLRGDHFGRAEVAVWERIGESKAAHVSDKLLRIARIMDDARLTAPRLDWSRTFAHDEESAFAGEAMRLRIEAKLLSEREMYEWARLSAEQGRCDYDRLRQCVLDLMVCGALRVHEALTLPVDALVKEHVYGADGEKALLATGEPLIRYGLRFWPGKGNEGAMLVKAIPTIMGPLAERAIRRAATITRGARRVAPAFHEKTSPFDGMTGFVPLDDSALTADDVGRLLGAREDGRGAGRLYVVPGVPGAFLRENPARGRGRRPPCRCIPRSDLEEALKRKSFSAFRSECKHGEIKLHECLFVIPFAMSTNRPGLNGTAQLLSYSSVKRYLVDHFGETASPDASTVEAGDASEGRSVTSHMFRMWLGTEARRGGLTRLNLSAWLNHADATKARFYDLRPHEEDADRLLSLIEPQGPDGRTARKPATAAFSDGIEEGTVGHATAAGVCSHEHQDVPCSFFLASAGASASETFLDVLSRAELEMLLARVDRLIAASEEAVERGTDGAGMWLEANRRWRILVVATIAAKPAAEAARPELDHGAAAA